jgi:hypothetical protein
MSRANQADELETQLATTNSVNIQRNFNDFLTGMNMKLCRYSFKENE